MNGKSEITEKIEQLRMEINTLKSSQILGGDNSRVYDYYIEGQSPDMYKKNGSWVSKEIYDDPEYVPVPGSVFTFYSVVYPQSDDPFALISFKKMEIWRSGRLITLGNYTKGSDNFFGQMSSDGDRFLISHQKSGRGWLNSSPSSMGTRLIIEACPMGSLSETTPFHYTYKIWFRSTNPSGYGFLSSTEEM